MLTPISKARTYEEIAEFWDTHSLAGYWDQTHEVEFEARAKPRRRVTVDPEEDRCSTTSNFARLAAQLSTFAF